MRGCFLRRNSNHRRAFTGVGGNSSGLGAREGEEEEEECAGEFSDEGNDMASSSGRQACNVLIEKCPPVFGCVHIHGAVSI